MTEKQLDWIFGKARGLIEKYEPLLPMEQDKWQELIHEVDDIDKKSRNNRLMSKLLVATTEYLDYTEREIRKGNLNG